MGILVFIIVGAIAGFAASKVVRGKGMGLLWDIVVGIVGAFLGGFLARLVGLPVDTGTFTVGGLLAAFVGAAILLIVFRALTGRGVIHT
jgi:uncharacterized membrane protein YeaQ/YmgE (transglycosylase-associated protein family)